MGLVRVENYIKFRCYIERSYEHQIESQWASYYGNGKLIDILKFKTVIRLSSYVLWAACLAGSSSTSMAFSGRRKQLDNSESRHLFLGFTCVLDFRLPNRRSVVTCGCSSTRRGRCPCRPAHWPWLWLSSPAWFLRSARSSSSRRGRRRLRRTSGQGRRPRRAGL